MPTILDHLGRPVNLGALKQEHGRASLSGVRTVWHDPIATGLTPSELGTILAAAAEGDHEAYLTLAEEMEEREAHYFGVLRTRKIAVSQLLPFVEARSDSAEDVKIADAVTELIDDPNMVDVYEACLDAIAKGYSMVEMIWDTTGKEWRPERYEWRDPRFFLFDQDTLSTIGLLDAENMVEGLPLAPFKWIQHVPKAKMGIPIRGGLARLIAAYYMCKSFSLKDWLAFAEIFGIPIRTGTYASGTTEDDIATLVEAVTNLGTDAAAVYPETMGIEIQAPNQGAGGAPLFEGLADYLDKQTSKAVLGQTMTTDDGSSLAQAKVHGEVRVDIRDADAHQLAKTIRRDLIGPFVVLNFGADKPVPKFRLATEESEDLEALSKALPPFIDRGLGVEASVIRDKFSLPEPEEGAELLQPKSGGGGGFGGNPGEDEKDKDKGNPEPEPEPDGEADKARAVNTLVTTLAKRARAGEELTAEQWRFLELAAVGDQRDEIDRLANKAARDWRKTIGPLADAIVAAAGEADSPEAFRAKLAELDINTDDLVSSLALEFFKARGLGDATDKIK